VHRVVVCPMGALCRRQKRFSRSIPVARGMLSMAAILRREWAVRRRKQQRGRGTKSLVGRWCARVLFRRRTILRLTPN